MPKLHQAAVMGAYAGQTNYQGVRVEYRSLPPTRNFRQCLVDAKELAQAIGADRIEITTADYGVYSHAYYELCRHDCRIRCSVPSDMPRQALRWARVD